MLGGAVVAVIRAGLVCGTLDGAAALANALAAGAKNPLRVFAYIASGLVGRDTAYAGGAAMIALGILLHYVIATGWSAVYAVTGPRLPIRSSFRSRWVIGPLYGVFVWLMMNLVVVPLSRVTSFPFTVKGVVIGLAIHVVCVGLPIVWIIERDRSRRRD